MASEKKVPLSIVLRTVDNATAKITAINKRIDDAFKPYREFSKQAKELSKNLGLPGLASGLGKVRDELGKMALRAAGLAAAVGVGFHALMGMVDELDDLGDTAQRIGLTAEALAEYRFAAEQAGAETGEIDSAFEGFNKRLGELRGGTGQLDSFLKRVSPKLREQLKHTKSSDEAFALLADAMTKLDDPTKRARLAMSAFGKSAGPGLIGLLSQGSDGIAELRAEFDELSGGTTNEAVASADEIKAAQGRAKVAYESVRNVIVTGLAPAITELANKAGAFLKENRERIAEWVRDFGEKLPGRIQALINAFKAIKDAIQPVWDAIGGAKGAVIALAVAISAKLLIAIGSVIASLWRVVAALKAAGGAASAAGAAGGGGAGVAAGSNLVTKVAGATAAGSAGFAIGSWLDEKLGLSDKGSDRDVEIERQLTGRGSLVQNPWQQASLATGSRIRNLKNRYGTGAEATPAAPVAAAPAQAKIKIELANATKGTRVTTDPTSDADVETSVGYQMEFY